MSDAYATVRGEPSSRRTQRLRPAWASKQPLKNGSEVNIKIAGKWMFIPVKMVLIGIDP
jgi:hypothetical protein